MDYENIINNRLIAAHRGYSYLYPENTLIAFENSLGKSDLIEFDVQFSKDGIAIIMHDETLIRTSDFLSINRFETRSHHVIDFTLEELLVLDFGIHKKCENQKILTLDEFLDFAYKNDTAFNLEIKDMSNTRFDECCVETIMNILKSKKCQHKIIISSFNHKYLKQLRQLDKEIYLAALIYEREQLDYDFLSNYNINGCHISDEIATKELIDKLKERGLYIGVYTVNSQIRKMQLFEMGVNIIFTDILE